MPVPVLPSLITGQVWEVLTQGTLNNGATLCYNSLRFRVNAVDPMSPIPDKARRDFLALYETAWRTQMMALMCNNYVLPRTILHCITSVTPRAGHPTQPSVHYSEAVALDEAPPLVGGVATPPEPDFVAVEFVTQVGVISRHWRGGFHVSAIPTASVLGQRLTDAAEAAFSAAATGLVGTYTPVGDNVQFVPVKFAGQLAISQPMGATYELGVNYTRDIINVAVQQRLGSLLHRKARPAN